MALAPIAALCLFLGVWTQPFLDSVRPDLHIVERIADGAKERADLGWNSPVSGHTSAPVAAIAGEKTP